MHHFRDIISKRKPARRSQREVNRQVGTSLLPTAPGTSALPVEPITSLLWLPVNSTPPRVVTTPVAPQLPTHAVSDIPLLPTELWIHILSYLDTRKDLLALSRTSRLLRTLSLRAMCRTVDMAAHKRHPLQWPIKLGIQNPLQSPEVATIVTHLRVDLESPHYMCRAYFVSMQPNNGLSCTCARLDTLLGDCLLATVNLQVLLFTCRLSCSYTDPRHRYLEHLNTRKLRMFSFYCYCAPNSTVQCEDVLAAPCSTSIEALHWNAPANYTIPRHSRIVPNLLTLYYQGTLLDSHLLATRPIQRICITGVTLPDDRLRQALLSTSGSFTHFSIGNIEKLALLIPVKPSLFSNLQHIGTVPAVSRYDVNGGVEAMLLPFASLEHLASIDAAVTNSSHLWDGILLTRLKDLFPNLLRVFCYQNPMAIIWHFKENSWVKRNVPTFTPWHIISGALDDEGGPLFPRLG